MVLCMCLFVFSFFPTIRECLCARAVHMDFVAMVEMNCMWKKVKSMKPTIWNSHKCIRPAGDVFYTELDKLIK